jgi:acyl-CoA synthetase (AMP-forming)/AMP-acid ligase II
MEKKWYSAWEPGVPKLFEPEHSIPAYFKSSVAATPEAIALSFYGCDISYRELADAVDRFAGALAGLGVRKGDRVALYMESCPQFAISFLGILQAGGIAVPLNPMFKHAELQYELDDCGARTLISLDFLFPEVEKLGNASKLTSVILTSFQDYLPGEPTLPLAPEMKRPKLSFPGTHDFMELLRSSAPQPAVAVSNLKENIALLQYTGGTTGLPKGAAISHYALAHSTFGSVLWFHYGRDDVHLGAAPFFHSYGMAICLCGSLVTGGRVAVLARVSPEAVVKAIAHYRCTVWITTATMVTAVTDWPELSRYDLSSLRMVLYGAAPMPAPVAARLEEIVPRARIRGGYGLTETMAGGGAVSPLSCCKVGFIGIPNISTDIKIVDLNEAGKELGVNEEGEILIRCGSMMTGYWNRSEETGEVLKDGWLYTGDIGTMDQDGWVAVVGRKKELMKCSGYSVFPAEVEELLHKHPAVSQVIVVGVEDRYRGETPKAFVVLKSEYKGKVTENEIIDWAKGNMAAYKRPGTVEFRDDLPKSAAGKLLRRVLADEERVRRSPARR